MHFYSSCPSLNKYLFMRCQSWIQGLRWRLCLLDGLFLHTRWPLDAHSSQQLQQKETIFSNRFWKKIFRKNNDCPNAVMNQSLNQSLQLGGYGALVGLAMVHPHGFPWLGGGGWDHPHLKHMKCVPRKERMPWPEETVQRESNKLLQKCLLQRP